MPRKISSHDAKFKERVKKLGTVTYLTADQKRARKYRSSGNWQKVRRVFLMHNPLCEDIFGIHADNNGRAEPAKEVDHILPLVKRFDLRAYRPNLSALCVRCHHKKSAMETKGMKTRHLFKRDDLPWSWPALSGPRPPAILLLCVDGGWPYLSPFSSPTVKASNAPPFTLGCDYCGGCSFDPYLWPTYNFL